MIDDYLEPKDKDGGTIEEGLLRILNDLAENFVAISMPDDDNLLEE